MKHNENDLIKNDIPVVCYEIEKESELPFISNGKSYGYKCANIDHDYAGMAYMGFCYGSQKMSFDKIKKNMIQEEINKLEKKRNRVTNFDFFKENDEFYPEYERLLAIVGKYRRRRAGNPDVIKLNSYIEDHGGLNFEIRRYDIKYNSMFFNYYPKIVRGDGIVCRTVAKEKEDNATLERRIEMANTLIDNEEDAVSIAKDNFSMTFDFIEDNYKMAITTIKSLLKEYKEVFLLYPRSGKSQKYVIPFTPNIIDANLLEFTIEDYLYALPNTLYRFKEEN